MATPGQLLITFHAWERYGAIGTGINTTTNPVEWLLGELHAAQSAPLGLAEDTSNLFRDRAPVTKQRLDVRALNDVLVVDAAAG